MPDTEKEQSAATEANAAEEDPRAGGAPEEPLHEGVVVSVSRGMGAAARAMSEGLHSMAGLFGARRTRRVKQPAESLETLLVQLGELVAARAEDLRALGDEEAFWQLIRKLHRYQHRKRMQRTPDEVNDATSEGDAQPADQAGAEAAPSKKPARKTKRKTTEAAAATAAQTAAAAGAGGDDEDELLLPTEHEEAAESEPAEKKKKS